MAEPAIRCEGIGKRYLLGQTHWRRGKILRDVLADALRRPFRRGPREAPPEEFWALRDVSFEVPEGEVLGIIGRNGAGKTTMLKVLGRITEPTEGTAWVRGRVGSLLEVGTGFHGELTGRENIFFNGAILGMSRAEIRRKFDEIVAFAGVEEFLDTPVKRYSSGMYVRLAFAVAAHLEPEILLVDEVLAVGDFHFQSKCLGKIREVSQGGRTVLFVSHNMAAIEGLCRKCLLMEGGRVQSIGEPQEIVSRYLSSDKLRTRATGFSEKNRRGTGQARITSVEVASTKEPRTLIQLGVPFDMSIEYDLAEELPEAVVALAVLSWRGDVVMTSWNTDDGREPRGLFRGGRWTCRVDHNVLTPGAYTVRGAVFKPRVSDVLMYDMVDEAVRFEVVVGDGLADYANFYRMGHTIGLGTWAFEPKDGISWRTRADGDRASEV